MTRLTPALGLALILLIATAADQRAGAQTRSQIAANTAVVTSMYGSVSVRHGTGGWVAATLNTVLKSGDAIRTGTDSRAELTIHGSGSVRLDANSHLLITYLDDKRGSSLKALVGGLWVSVERALVGPNGLKVEMPSAVAAVKGTVFRCTVSEQGDCETAVYDGEVECECAGERYSVTPGRYFARAHALAAAVHELDLDTDAVRDWVAWNHRKDLLNVLGNPRVVLAAAERNGTGRLTAPAAQAKLAERLARAGFNVAVVPAASLPDDLLDTVTTSADAPATAGKIVERLRHARVTGTGDASPDATAGAEVGDGDLVVAAGFLASTGASIGRGSTQGPPQPSPGTIGMPRGSSRPLAGVYGSRSSGRGMIIDPATARALYQWDARRAGQGADEHAAGRQALANLGDRFGDELVPELIDAMVARKQMVRLRLHGVGSRQALLGFITQLGKHPRLRRVFALKYGPDAAVLGVLTDLPAPELAGWVKDCTSGGVHVLSVEGSVIEARSAAAAAEPVRPPRSDATVPPHGVGTAPQGQGRPVVGTTGTPAGSGTAPGPTVTVPPSGPRTPAGRPPTGGAPPGPRH